MKRRFKTLFKAQTWILIVAFSSSSFALVPEAAYAREVKIKGSPCMTPADHSNGWVLTRNGGPVWRVNTPSPLEIFQVQDHETKRDDLRLTYSSSNQKVV